MIIFDNVDDLIAHLSNDVKSSLLDIKENYIDDEMEQAIEETVYSVKFESKNGYQRREKQNGLKDRRNFESDIASTPNGVEMKIRNTTTGNQRYSGSTPYEIDSIIVSGKGYSWRNSNYYISNQLGRPIKRDFYKATHGKVKNRLGGLLTQELKNKGW